MWQVGSENRLGIFAGQHILPGCELTIDYKVLSFVFFYIEST